MSDEKKTTVKNDEITEQEISLDELDNVTGGSIGNVKYTKTVDISGDTKSKA